MLFCMGDGVYPKGHRYENVLLSKTHHSYAYKQRDIHVYSGPAGKQAVAMEFRKRRLAALVFTTFSAHVQTSRQHRLHLAHLMHVFDTKSRTNRLLRAFSVWKARYATHTCVRQLEDLAVHHCNTRMLRTCVRRWIHHVQCLQTGKMLTASADKFRNEHLQENAFYTWRYTQTIT